MHKERNELCIIYQLIYGSVLQVRAYYIYSPRNQQYKLSKTPMQRSKEAQLVSCFNSYAPELVRIFYSAIKREYRCFIS